MSGIVISNQLKAQAANAKLADTTVSYADLKSITEIGKSYFVRDVGAGLVECRNDGFGWRPVKPFALQPLLQEHTHLDTSVGVSIPWAVTLPAGLMRFGYVEVVPMITFPSSASSKKVELKVNGTALFGKTRTTATHESPVIIVNARDSAMINYPYYTNSVPISGGTGFTTMNGMTIDNRSSDIAISLETSFGAVGAGTESIVTRFVRATFNPF